MSRRLLQIATSLDDSPDSATMGRVSRRMADEGLQVAVLSLQGHRSLVADPRWNDVQVIGVEPPIRHAAQMLYQVRRAVQDFRPDVVHTWSARANRLGRFVAATAQVPVVFASYRAVDPRESWWTNLTNRQLDRCTRICVVNTQSALDLYGRPSRVAGKLRLIRDGVPERQRATASQRDAVRARLGLDLNAKLVGIVGPLDPDQHVKDTIWAVDLLRVFHPGVRLLVIGTGPDRWRLERYATQVQDSQRTLFLDQPPDWIDFIAALDCLCQPARRLIAPVAILEAMAAGVPVVATNTAGHRELITPNQTGLLVPLGDRGALARQLHQVLDNPSLGERLTAAAGRFVRQHHAEDEMLSRYVELYREEPSRVAGPLSASS